MSADDAVTEALWQKARADFAADEPQRAFIEHCRQSGRLPEAARRYREEKERAGAEAAELIHKRLAAIAILAMSELDAGKRSPAPRRSPPALILFAAVVLALAIYGLVVALRWQ